MRTTGMIAPRGGLGGATDQMSSFGGGSLGAPTARGFGAPIGNPLAVGLGGASAQMSSFAGSGFGAPAAGPSGNPLAGGLAGAAGQGAFGQSTFDQPLNNTPVRGQARGGFSSIGTGSTVNRGGLAGGSGMGVNPLSPVLTGNGLNGGLAANDSGAFVTPPAGAPTFSQPQPLLVSNQNQVLGLAPGLRAVSNAQVADPAVLVLRGDLLAGSPAEAARQSLLIEALMRLRPGVGDLRNELQFDGTPLPTPRPVR
jgi:hypothetical protein